MTERVFSRGTVATALALFGLAVSASGAVAECMDSPPSRDASAYVGYAFTASVSDVSHDTDPPRQGNAPFDWRVALDVQHVYRGSVPDPLILDGWDVGCSGFYGDNLNDGDRLFISVDRLDPDRNPSLYGDVLVWRRTEDGWRFYEHAVRYGSDERYYPPAARSATSISDILALVGPDALPDTATAAPEESAVGASVAPPLLVVLLGALVAVLRRGPLALRA